MTDKSRHDNLTEYSIEQFKNHVIRSSGEDRWTLKQPYKDGKGYDSNLWVEIVILKQGGLLVTGDIDSVIFRYFGGPPQKWNSPTYQRAILTWIGGRHEVDSYIMEKASIGAGGNRYVNSIFSPTAAEQECLEWSYQRVDEDILDTFLYNVGIYVDIIDPATRKAFIDGTIGVDSPTPENLKKVLYSRDYASYDITSGTWKKEGKSLYKFETMGGVFEFFGANVSEVVSYIKRNLEDDAIYQVWTNATSYAGLHEVDSSMAGAVTFNNRLYEALDEAGLGDVFEYVGSIGVVPSCHMYYAWAAIRRLLEILKEEDQEETS